MKPLTVVSRLVLILAALLPASAGYAGDNSDIRVDVVVDMTDAGKKIARPTPDHPAYYFPLTVGYKEEGAFVPDQKLPPPTAEVQHLIAKALYEQGYRVMTDLQAPSLTLVFWWGHMAPEVQSSQMRAPAPTTSNIHVGFSGLDDPFAFQMAINEQLPVTMTGNEKEMISLVAGNTRDYQYATEKPNTILQQVLTMEREPRHYLMVSAYDFHDWLRHTRTLLWQAHVSTELWGRNLDQVLPTMIATAAPMFGRETTAPQLIDAPVAPMGRVIVGAPEVKDYPSTSK